MEFSTPPWTDSGEMRKLDKFHEIPVDQKTSERNSTDINKSGAAQLETQELDLYTLTTHRFDVSKVVDDTVPPIGCLTLSPVLQG